MWQKSLTRECILQWRMEEDHVTLESVVEI